jgi:hypothetical protein
MARSAASTARGSDAASSYSASASKAVGSPAEQHCLVDSDDEGLLSAEELEWALAQRSTDPFIKQRALKGKFMVSKQPTVFKSGIKHRNSHLLKGHRKLQPVSDT